MRVFEGERLRAISTNATIVVPGRTAPYNVETLESKAVIAEGFRTKAAAESYAKVLRARQTVQR
jgi:hypothetical protein